MSSDRYFEDLEAQMAVKANQRLSDQQFFTEFFALRSIEIVASDLAVPIEPMLFGRDFLVGLRSDGRVLAVPFWGSSGIRANSSTRKNSLARLSNSRLSDWLGNLERVRFRVHTQFGDIQSTFIKFHRRSKGVTLSNQESGESWRLNYAAISSIEIEALP